MIINLFIWGGGKNSNLPFVILTTNDNKLTYTPNKIYKMNEIKVNSRYSFMQKHYISLNDVNVKDIKNNDKIAYENNNYLYYSNYYYDGYGGLIIKNLKNYKEFFNNKNLIIKSDSIDVKDGDNLITTLTLTGLKRKDSDTRDFVGEIASYQDDLIKVDRTNPDNPTVQFLSFNNSQYKDNYEREERIKLYYIPYDIL